MKKYLVLLISAVLLIALASCGEIRYDGEYVSATVKGSGSKTVTLTIRGDELAGKEISTNSAGEAGASYFRIALSKTKQKGKTYVYKITGFEAGSSGCDIIIFNEDSSIYAAVSAPITVSEDLKVTCGDVIISDEPKYIIDTDELRIPFYKGNMDSLMLKNGDGVWSCYSFDDTYITVDDPKVTEDGFSEFAIHGVSDGKTSVKFINEGIMRQALFNFVITENADENGGVYYAVNLADYTITEYTLEEYIEDKRAKGEVVTEKDVEDIKEKFPTFKLPEGCVIIGGGIILPDEADDFKNLSVDLVLDGVFLDYEIRDDLTWKQACDRIDLLEIPQKYENLEIGNGTVRYYFTTYGFSVAMWESQGFISTLTFMDDVQDDQTNRLILRKFLGDL